MFEGLSFCVLWYQWVTLHRAIEAQNAKCNIESLPLVFVMAEESSRPVVSRPAIRPRAIISQMMESKFMISTVYYCLCSL